MTPSSHQSEMLWWPQFFHGPSLVLTGERDGLMILALDMQ
jgi:hypothetical protein